MYAIATSISKDMQMAINSAKEDACVSIVRQLEAKINSMFKRFREEVGWVKTLNFLAKLPISQSRLLPKCFRSRERPR